MISVKIPVGVLRILGSKSDIFGEQAEDQFGREKGDARWIGIPVAHVVCDNLKGLCGVGGDLLGITAWIQTVGIVKHVAKPGEFLRVAGDFGYVMKR